MEILITDTVHQISFAIGVIGVGVVLIGTLRALWHFCWKPKTHFVTARHTLGVHILLGLDFFVGKDIIDAAFIKTAEVRWIELASLLTIVGIRVLLTYFLSRELKEVEAEEAKLK